MHRDTYRSIIGIQDLLRKVLMVQLDDGALRAIERGIGARREQEERGDDKLP